jgi:hypothetical protein
LGVDVGEGPQLDARRGAQGIGRKRGPRADDNRMTRGAIVKRAHEQAIGRKHCSDSLAAQGRLVAKRNDHGLVGCAQSQETALQ